MSDAIELKEADKQFIIGRIPSWILFGGNVTILLVFVLLLIFSFRMTFPLVIQGTVEVRQEHLSVTIPLTKREQIQFGQEVRVRMDDYPYMEHGALKGHVADLTQIIQKEHTLFIPIDLSDDSNSVKKNDLIEGMRGEAEIVVDRVPLIYRIFKLH